MPFAVVMRPCPIYAMAFKKNVLLAIADKSLGCYGEEPIKTPNINMLAKEGTLFDNSSASTASC